MRFAPQLGLFALIFLLGWAVTQVYQRRLARDLYPRYSSLRADPVGLRALHDAVNELPFHRATRWVRPVADFPEGEGQTVLLAGLKATGYGDGMHFNNEDRRTLQRIAVRGGRVVLAFERMTYIPPWEETAGEPVEVSADEGEESDPAEDEVDDLMEALLSEPEELVSLGFSLDYRYVQDDRHVAQRVTPEPGSDLPSRLPWSTHAFVVPDEDTADEWTVHYLFGAQPVIVERSWGRGSIAVMTETYPLSNEALLRAPRPGFLRWVMGGNSNLLMVESHLGVVEDPGVAALARRYGLGSAAIVLGIWVLLFVWRRMALFLPAPPPPTSVNLTYEPTAGLEALLRRAVPPEDLVATCVTEWRKTAGDGDKQRVPVPDETSPTSEYNTISRALRRR